MRHPHPAPFPSPGERDRFEGGAREAQTPKRGGVFRIRGEDAASGFDPHLVVVAWLDK